MHCQLGHPGISQDIPVNCCISKQSHVQRILLCPRMFHDILKRDMQFQLGHPAIFKDIPINCCISKQSHVQRILLCPRMSQNIPGHPNKRYAVPARTSGDIPGHPSQLQQIHTIPCPAHPIVYQDVLRHPGTS